MLYTKFRKYFSLLRYCVDQLKAIVKFWKYSGANTSEVKFTRLRTACHILDKGLNSTPFEKGHGMLIYREARKLLEEVKDRYQFDDAYLWAEKIVSNYEKAQRNSFDIENCNPILFTVEERERLFNAIKARVSCRNFKKMSISDDVLKEIVKIAVDAPNGCCRQTVRYYVLQDTNQIEKCIPDIAGITCFSNIPCLVCVTSFSPAYDLIDRNLQYVDASLSLENFVLAARAYNIFTTICNVFHASSVQLRHLKETFCISEAETIVAVVAMGYSEMTPHKPVRMNVENFIHFCR